MVKHTYKLSSFGDVKRLTGIDETLAETLLFGEKLYVFNENGLRVGRFSLKVERDDKEYESSKCLYVHISNRAFIDGKLSESIVTGTVTTRLKTLEEIRYECSEVPGTGKHERIMFLLREKTKYYVSLTNNVCGLKSQMSSSIPFVEALGLIGESSNALFLRILALKGYEGIICLKTLMSNGKQCRNYYVTKLSEQIVNRTRMQVLVVYRNITNNKKINLTMTLALTRAGQLIYLFWSNSKYFLHIDPDAEVSTSRFYYATPRLEYVWHKDLQLYSMYLDKVDQRKMYSRSYKYEIEPLRRIVGDFFEYVLFIKPTDVVCFAIKYFTVFDNKYKPSGCLSRVQSPTGCFEEQCFEDLPVGEEDEMSYNSMGEKESFFFGGE
ncbi:hypothetical protein RUM43_008020 [Polyplax serrata]|uniref:Ciliogenesis-associated TTC17-interacting protein N-terminal domain-containing protein n=1 Tax=Polyplax serrata TaxID=468196 RepID=A0AAN8P6H4_POLSC